MDLLLRKYPALTKDRVVEHKFSEQPHMNEVSKYIFLSSIF